MSACPEGAHGEVSPPAEFRCSRRRARGASPVRERRVGARWSSDSGGMKFPTPNAGRRLGQGGGFGLRVKITLSLSPRHLKYFAGALHEAHQRHHQRFDPALERRRGHNSE